jgi:quinoprotein glucose dehydrogenase
VKHLTTGVLLAGVCVLALEAVQARMPGSGPDDPRPAPHTSWNDYGGGADSSQYSALKQINRANVSKLQVAWKYATGDGGGYLFNPIVVDGVMYVQAKGGSIVALDAARAGALGLRTIRLRGSPRGHETGAGPHGRRLLFSSSQFLQAIDATTGKGIPTFGESGRVDLRVGLDRDPSRINAQSNTPGKVFEDVLILGSATNQGYTSAPGDIRAFDVRSGSSSGRFAVPRREFG